MCQIAPFEVLDILLNSEDAGLTEQYVVSTLFWKVSVLCKWIFACKCKSATADRIRWLQLQGASPLKWSYHQRRSSCNIIHHHRHHRVLTKTQFLRKACDDNFRTSTIDEQERIFSPKPRSAGKHISIHIPSYFEQSPQIIIICRIIPGVGWTIFRIRTSGCPASITIRGEGSKKSGRPATSLGEALAKYFFWNICVWSP